MKVGLCGYGNMGRMHAQLVGKHDGVTLVAVADVQADMRARAEKDLGVKTYESGEALIDARVADVVFVCAPTYLHAPLSIRALNAGAHVFTEKPMGLTARECDAMIAAARRQGRHLAVGQVLRFWPEYSYLKQAIDSGRFGALQSLSMTRVGGVSIGFERWFLDEKRGGMQIFDRHIHDTDLTLWLLGMPDAVQSFGVEKDPRTDGGIIHSFTRYLYHGRDLAVSAEGSADCPAHFPFTMGYRAVFENAAIEYSNRQAPTLKLYTGGEPETPELPQPLGEIQSGLNISSASGYFLEQVYFFDCIRKGRPLQIVTPESARDTVRVVRAEIRSARRDGARVSLA
ncbi:MAG: Gfo/Idh/MocA family oxidoreductase [Lentisphaerae bacterium]|nr:Gfo/Idh/MocA family oxidoreductase [Lentisphaerota bacterium]